MSPFYQYSPAATLPRKRTSGDAHSPPATMAAVSMASGSFIRQPGSRFSPARAAEDSLRGLFLRDLKSRLDSARTEEERQRITMAARFGLAALDHRDLG